MNIALISVAPPYRGGISEHTKGLYSQLNKNHSVKIFSFYYQYPKLFFPGENQVVSKKYNNQNTDYCISTLNLFSWIQTSNKIIDFNPNLVIFTYWNPYFAPSFGFIARKLKTVIGSDKLISIFHNVIPHERNFFDRFLFKYYIKPFKKCVFMSSFVRDQLKFFKENFQSTVRFLPIDKNYEIKLSKNIIRKEMNININDKIILFFGLIRKYKGLEILLEAIKKYSKYHSKFKLIIAGESYEKKQKYINIINTLNIKNKVIWFDKFIANEQIEKLMILSDLLILPYNSASQSGVLSQAWQYEIPVIVTDVGGLSEYVDHGYSGYIVEKNNSDKLFQKIEYFFESKAALQMQKYIKTHKNKFSWENYIKGIWELVNES